MSCTGRSGHAACATTVALTTSAAMMSDTRGNIDIRMDSSACIFYSPPPGRPKDVGPPRLDKRFERDDAGHHFATRQTHADVVRARSEPSQRREHRRHLG